MLQRGLHAPRTCRLIRTASLSAPRCDGLPFEPRVRPAHRDGDGLPPSRAMPSSVLPCPALRASSLRPCPPAVPRAALQGLSCHSVLGSSNQGASCVYRNIHASIACRQVACATAPWHTGTCTQLHTPGQRPSKSCIGAVGAGRSVGPHVEPAQSPRSAAVFRTGMALHGTAKAC